MAKINGSVLIVDDNPGILESLSFIIGQDFKEVETVSQPAKFTSLLQSGNYDVILLDMNFSPGARNGNEGLFWLRKIREHDPQAVVILITAYGDVQLAVEAMKAGATDFIEKPYEPAKLIGTLKSAYELRQSRKQINKLQQTQKQLSQELNKQYSRIIGESLPLKQVFEQVKKVAPTDANVLILGENGTGKELIAREIHRLSERSDEALFHADLNALPETLFESELFGHKKGAFTHAEKERVGLFETASGGTLFLDEIGNLPVSLQGKLLTVLQNRTIIPLGSSKTIPVDVRLITATNKNLPQLIQEEHFRKDLLFRINTVEIHLPPLRERGEDIVLLANHFLDLYEKKYNKPGLKIADKALHNLMGYSWPGNIRELQHMIENATIMCDSPTITSSLFRFSNSAAADTKLTENNITSLSELEEKAIGLALKRNKGNINKTANELGITRKTLYNKIKKYEL
jgi:DNA-binding NtrC family response regulator